jgi:serine/threonine-protein kinase
MFDAQRDAVSPVVEYDATIAAPWAPLAVWTPDGKFIIFRFRGGWEEGKWGMYWLRAGSSGPPQRLTTSNLSQTPASFTPDGHTLAFYQGSGLLGSSDIWTVTISNDGSTLRAGDAKPFVETKADENHPSFSRDGRWIAYSSAGQAVPEIYVKPWPDDGRSWQISAGGGSQPLFSRTRDELFFLSADQQIMVVPYRASNDGFTAERPRRWSERRVADLGATFWSYDLLPGQQGFVALTVPDDSRQRTQGSLVVLLNAFDHLRRIAPAK